MREIFKSGSVGRAPGNRCLYLEPDPKSLRLFVQLILGVRLPESDNEIMQEMETATVSIELYSPKEKQIARSILKGESLRNCARRNSISEYKCRSIMNNYCLKSDHDLYSSLRWNKWETSAPLSKLRQHAQEFFAGAERNEHVDLGSSIWSLPGVPTMTLNALEGNGISTIDKLIHCDKRKLPRLRKMGEFGLHKLNMSLAKFGFSIMN